MLGSAFFFVGTEWLLQVHVIPKDNMIKRAQLFHRQESLNILIGDSQLRDAVNFLPGFVNLSTGSQKYPEMELKIFKYYKNVDEPFKIIIHGAINGFAKYRNRPVNKSIYEFYMEDKTSPPFILTNYYQSRASLYWTNFIENSGKIVIYAHHYNEDGSTTRFDDASLWLDETMEINMLKTQKKYIPLTEPKSLVAYKSLERIFEFLKTKQAEICIVVPPVHNRLKAEFVREPKVVEVLDIFKYLSKEYDAHYVSYWPDVLPNNYFNDLTHVNQRGAQYVTSTIYQRCFGE